MRMCPCYLAILIEVKNFGGCATVTMIVEGYAVDADQRGKQLKMEMRGQFKRLGPIRGHRCFAFQGA